jgi:hypothetical protein
MKLPASIAFYTEKTLTLNQIQDGLGAVNNTAKKFAMRLNFG